MEGVGVLKGFELRRGSQMPGEGVLPRLQLRGRVSEERLVQLERGQEAGGTAGREPTSSGLAPQAAEGESTRTRPGTQPSSCQVQIS